MEELIEAGDRKFIGQYSFYSILHDPPYEELSCYPLEKEWEEVLLNSCETVVLLIADS